MVKRQIIKKIFLLCVLLNFIKAQCPEQCECAGGDDICTSCISEDKWGPQCLDDCGERCSGGCDFTSGICSQCKAGFWQEDCSSSCGNCQEQSEGVSICNRESGACSSQGCISGYYGTQCDQDCPTTCNPASCDRDSGNCEACQSGKYGSKCNEDCGNCKNKDGDTSICNFSDGKCNDEGCVDGYYGDYCKSSCQYTCKTSACDRTTGECEACPSGKYGSTCNDNCGNCKNKDGDTSICNFSDGKCNDEGCLDGYHGDYCKDNCPSTCKTPACDRSTGDCLACPPGKYGNLCDEDCGNCKTKEGETSICDFNDGKCDDEGCLDGYHGDYCKEECPTTCKTPSCDRTSGECLACPPGKYGSLCDGDCGNCKTKEGETSICDFNDGKCDAEGCLDGYHGDLCKEECPTTCSTSACDRTTGDCLACPNGKYYKDCSKDCGFCKNQVDGTSICNFEDGKCDSQGCLPGYYGELCLDKCADNCKDGLCDASGCSECIPGKWNTNCTDNCGYCANLDETTNTSICLKDTGLCDSQGCLPGYYGEKCLDKCADNCKDGLCDASGCLECIPGKWDSNCTNSCGNCAHLDESTNTPICSKDTGKCDDQGCQPGFYGEMCLDKCADNCKDGLCNEDGCIECIPGKWDSNCENSCGHCAHLDENTNTSICIKETGLCDEQGCLPGYSGEACNNGCPTDCLDGLCDISTGECFSCNPGKYSKDCTLDCGHCLNKQGDISICDFESGLCDNNGCEPGFFLQNCTGICPLNCEENICDINSGLCNACIPGKWFEDCTKDCGHCANKDLNSNSSICDIETGNCDEKGCEAGFYGADCNLECPKDCVDGRCDNEGKCLNCPPGTWGNSCESTCDINCNLTTANCDITTGYCLNCNSGFYTSDIDQKECLQCKENCLKECSASEGCFECKEPHQFGQWCEEECPNCKEGEDGKFCYRNGTCLGECIQTFYSEFCNETCPEHCAYEGNNSCSQDLGECEECEIGFFPKKCDKCPIACISCNSLEHCFECVELDKFGEVCTETCNPNCYREENQTIHICNKDTGRCNSCIPGFYTPTCNEPCPNGCTECNQDSGECGSCEPNFYLEEGICKPCGIECNQCSNGTYCTECNNLTHYGPLCEEICPEHCLYTPATRLLSYNNLKDEIRKCDRITGNCFGCEENFIGDQCENCVDSKYGELCDLNCEEGCDISKGNCDRLNSSCICKDGYFGYNCSEICQDGCIRCDQATGDCIDCEIDYYNDEGFCEHCSENCTEGMGCSKTKCNSCIDGKYGDLCESFCSPHCSNVTCEQDTGVCDGGCAPNFNGSLCLECNFKRYGEMCDKDCSEGCDFSEGLNCDMLTGNCTCLPTFWSPTCNVDCPEHCKDHLCDPETGNCYSCEDKYWGPTCENSCPENCTGKLCDSETGHCYSCEDGYYGDTCEDQCFSRCEKCDFETGKICERCNTGYFGISDCNSTCAEGCDLNQKNCNIEDGICSYCKDKYFGLKCDQICEGCDETGCDRTGKCKNLECQEGFYGPTCSGKCTCEHDVEAQESENQTYTCSKYSAYCNHCLFGNYGKKCEKYCSYKCQSISCCLFGTDENQPNFSFEVKSNSIKALIDGFDFELTTNFASGYPITLLTEAKDRIKWDTKQSFITRQIVHFGDLEVEGDLYLLNVTIGDKTFPTYVLNGKVATKLRSNAEIRDILPLGFFNQFTEDLIKQENYSNILSLEFEKNDKIDVKIGDIHKSNKKYYDKYYTCSIIKSENTSEILASDIQCYGDGVKLSNERDGFILDSVITFSFSEKSYYLFNSNYTKFFFIHYFDKYCGKVTNKTENGIVTFYCEGSVEKNRVPNFGFIIEKKVYYLIGSDLFVKENDHHRFIFNVVEKPPEGANEPNANDVTSILIGKEFFKDRKYAAINNEEGKLMVFIDYNHEYYNDKLITNLNKSSLNIPISSELFAGIIIIVIFIINVCVFLCYWMYKKKKVKGKVFEVLN